MRTSLIVAVSSIALLASPACKDTKKGKNKGKKSLSSKLGFKNKKKKRRGKKGASASLAAAAGSGAPVIKDPDRALGMKIDGYIQCVNGLAAGVRKSARRYASWAGKDPKKPPGKKTRIVYGTFKIQPHQIDRCAKAIAKAPVQPETPVLTTAGQSFLSEAKALIPLVDEAVDYYSRKGHKMDKFAQGKALHPKLTVAYDKAVKAANAMHSEVTKINDQLQERRLVRLEKQYGRDLRYLTSLTMMLAKKLVRLASVDTPKDIKGDEFEKAMLRYAAAIKEMNQYIRSKPAEAKRWSGMTFYKSAMNDYVKQLLALDDLRTGKRKWSRGDKMMMKRNPQMVKGHPAAVIKSYNSMVNASNRMKVR